MTYDSLRHRLLVFGGWDGEYHNDVWVMSLGPGRHTWHCLQVLGEPPTGRSGASAAYDLSRDRLIIACGFTSNGYVNEVWELSLGGTPTWALISPSGTPLSARSRANAIFDIRRNRLVLFGGQNYAVLGDTWELRLGASPAWREINDSVTSPAPSARSAQSAVYDEGGDRLIVFGGGLSEYTSLNDVWALSLRDSTWTQIQPNDPAPGKPTPRSGAALVLDVQSDRLVAFGGWSGTAVLQDTWSLPLGGEGAWAQLEPAAGLEPAARRYAGSVHDPVGQQMLVFGGWDGTDQRNDALALPLQGALAWDTLSVQSEHPSSRYGHTLTYDPVRRRMILYGGYSGSAYLNDVWEKSLLSPDDPWKKLLPSGTPPQGRVYHAAAYDPIRDRIVITGGYGISGLSQVVVALDLGPTPNWRLLTPAGTAPSPLYWHSSVYDPIRDRVIVLGGYHSAAQTWELSMAGQGAWSPLTPAGGPPLGLLLHSAVLDPFQNRMLVLGGTSGSGLNLEVWSLSLGGALSWSSLSPLGDPPTFQFGSPAGFDPRRNRVVVNGSKQAPAVRAVSLNSPPTWTPLSPMGPEPAGREYAAGFVDPAGDRFVLFGGSWNGSRFGDAWSLDWSDGASAVGPLSLSGIRPNRAGDSGPVTVTVYGQGFRDGTSLRLVRSGEPDEVADSVAIFAGGTTLRATLNFAGRARGLWDVIVSAPENLADTLEAGLTVEALRRPRVVVQVSGRRTVRALAPRPLAFVMENHGNVDVPGHLVVRAPMNALWALKEPLGVAPSDTASWFGHEGRMIRLPQTVVPAGGSTSQVIELAFPSLETATGVKVVARWRAE